MFFFPTLTWENIYFPKVKFWNAIREFEIFMFKSTKKKPEGRRKNIFPSSFWSNKKTLLGTHWILGARSGTLWCTICCIFALKLIIARRAIVFADYRQGQGKGCVNRVRCLSVDVHFCTMLVLKSVIFDLLCTYFKCKIQETCWSFLWSSNCTMWLLNNTQ